MSQSIHDLADRPDAPADAHMGQADVYPCREPMDEPERVQDNGQAPGLAARRFGQVLSITSEHIEEYERLHQAVWPTVLATIHACNIRNYSIFRYEHLLFAYFEYVGDDYEADMAKMAGDPTMQEWWSVCEPLQDPLPQRIPGEWWMTLHEVFHTE